MTAMQCFVSNVESHTKTDRLFAARTTAGSLFQNEIVGNYTATQKSRLLYAVQVRETIGADSAGTAGKCPEPAHNRGKVSFCHGTILSRLQILPRIKRLWLSTRSNLYR